MRVCSKKQKQKPRHTKVSLRENTQRSHLNIYHIPPDFCGLFLITGAGTTGVKFVTFGKSIEKKNNKKQQVWCFEYKRVNSCSFTVVFPRGFYNLAGQRKKKTSWGCFEHIWNKPKILHRPTQQQHLHEQFSQYENGRALSKRLRLNKYKAALATDC